MRMFIITRKQKKKILIASVATVLLCEVAVIGGVRYHSQCLSKEAEIVSEAESATVNNPLVIKKPPAQRQTPAKEETQDNTATKLVKAKREIVYANENNEVEEGDSDTGLLPDISYFQKAQLEDAIDLLSDLTD